MTCSHYSGPSGIVVQVAFHGEKSGMMLVTYLTRNAAESDVGLHTNKTSLSMIYQMRSHFLHTKCTLILDTCCLPYFLIILFPFPCNIYAYILFIAIISAVFC